MLKVKKVKDSEKGTTLLEIAIVMVCVGIIGAILVPNVMDSIRSLRLNSAAYKLVTDIRYARELALSNHATYAIEVSTANNNYQLYKVVGGVKTAITNPYGGGSMIVDFDTRPEFSGVTITTVTRGEFRFDSFGKPLDAFGTALTYPASVVLHNGNLDKSVSVWEETGYTQISNDSCIYTGKSGSTYTTAC